MEKKLEQAIKLVVDRFPNADNLIKPTIFHSIRVWMYLYDNWYDEDICLTGFLHDILEDTDVTHEELKTMFGEKVLEMVKANTQNDELPKEQRKEELIARCAKLSQEALIVKCADIIDNYWYRSRQWREDEVERCKKLTNLIKKYIIDSYQDKIFQKLFSLFE